MPRLVLQLLSTDKESEKWKSKAVTNAVAAAVAKRIKSVDLQDERGHLCRRLAVNDNSITTSTNRFSAWIVVGGERLKRVHGKERGKESWLRA